MTTPRPASRRAVLSGLVAGGAVSLGAAACGTTPSPQTRGNAAGRRILVIGAGAAGLSAAQVLLQAGLNVQVLEARDRIGGRIYTSRLWSDLPVDLGASWIHGVTGNPVSDLAAQAGATTIATSYESGDLHVAASLHSQGLRASETSRWERLVGQALDAVREQDHDASIQAALSAQPWHQGLTALEQADLAFYLAATYETEWGASVDELSSWSVDDGGEFGGGDVLLPNGFDAVVRSLAQGVSRLFDGAIRACPSRQRRARSRAMPSS